MKWQNWLLIIGFILAVVSFYLTVTKKDCSKKGGGEEENGGSGAAGLASPII